MIAHIPSASLLSSEIFAACEEFDPGEHISFVFTVKSGSNWDLLWGDWSDEEIEEFNHPLTFARLEIETPISKAKAKALAQIIHKKLSDGIDERRAQLAASISWSVK